MSKALELARSYFELSNKSDFGRIEKLFTSSTQYDSQTMGSYIGSDRILTMQKAFHSKFSSLKWNINSAQKIKPGVVLFDYDFVGRKTNGETVKTTGLEYITVKQDKIQNVEIRNKETTRN